MSDKSELYRPVDLATAQRSGGAKLTLEAGPRERTAIAARLGLLGLDRFEAEIGLEPWQGAGAVLSGRLIADAVQSCVVTLEPVPAHLTVSLEARFHPESRGRETAEEEILSDPEAPDPPEPWPPRGILDLGELLIQHLAVALDSYPRKAGVRFVQPGAGAAEGAAESPFAKLTALKTPRRS